VRHRLEQSTNDPEQKAIIDQFFGGGIPGVIRYLLVGPVVVPQHGNLLRVSAFSASVEDPPPADDPIDTDPVDTPSVAKRSDPVDATPAVAAAAAAPATGTGSACGTESGADP
jgi:hypothetical protein